MIRAACLLAAFVLSLFPATALAQEPPREDGVGPYRFGMSVEQARATAPQAAWSSERRRDRETLTGGPDIAFAGQMTTGLIFVANALTRVVLVGVAPGGCSEAVRTMVERLEPQYGAFLSVPPPAFEAGLLTAADRTASGSEIRLREGGEEGVVVSSARYGPMYIVVQGRAEAERCRLAMTFGPQSDWTRSDAGPGPTWAELDRAQSLPQPAWISRPDANSFARHYPDDALERGIGGEAILDCLVLENGVLHCRLIHETPVERGFGVAALLIARAFRVEQGADGVAAVGRRVRLPIRFGSGPQRSGPRVRR